jgi:hypothetical protein
VKRDVDTLLTYPAVPARRTPLIAEFVQLAESAVTQVDG